MLENEHNEAQALAIIHASGPMQVLAGPGSGKTYLTIHRIRHLIGHHGISPEHILVITFTKAAALEMEDRFLKLTNYSYPQVHFGTFHAVFFQILKQSGSNPTLASYKDKINYLTIILHSLNIAEWENKEALQDLLQKVSHQKNSVKNSSKLSPAEIISPKITPGTTIETEALTQKFPNIYEEYCRLMREENKIDFDDMILLCDELLTNNADALSYWQNLFQYILIDEFQDISPMQYRIMKRLSLPHNNLFVVGDDDQSIYGFRGSSPDIMKQFMKDYPNAVQTTLNINYRCMEQIVKTAEFIISKNQNRFAKQITASQKEGGAVNILSFTSAAEEYTHLIKQLKEMSADEQFKTAVIFRTNAEASLFAKQLFQSNIPFCIREKLENIWEHPVTKDFLAYLAFATELGKRSDFLRIMNKPLRYISRKAASSELISQNELLAYYKDNTYMLDTLHRFYNDLSRIAKLPPYLALDYIRKSIGYDFYLKSNENKNWLETADIIQKSASGYSTFKSWIEDMTKYSQSLTDSKDLSADYKKSGIHLLTMHASKGLEYDNVFLPDCKIGTIPNKKAVSSSQIEEERRLFYVSVTRAKRRLEILYYGTMSPFLTGLEKQKFITNRIIP